MRRLKRVLITGATGFVGRNVCHATDADTDAICRAALRRPAGRRDRPDGEGAVVGEIDGRTDWSDALRGVDAVVHLAARVHVLSETADDALAAFRKTNVLGTERLVEACRGSSVRRFVYASSIMAVGRGADRPYSESTACTPVDPYGQSKLEAERVVLDAGRRSGMETVILRPPLVYGPGVGGNFLRILKLVRRGLPLPLGMVRNARSMMHVDNLTQAIQLCLAHPAAAGETFHVADSIPISTRDLVRCLARHMNRPCRLVPVPTSLLRLAGTVTGRRADVLRVTGSLTVSTEKIERTLGWRPRIGMEEGIRRTVEHFLAERVGADRAPGERRRAA